jgi:hypothetical protein
LVDVHPAPGMFDPTEVESTVGRLPSDARNVRPHGGRVDRWSTSVRRRECLTPTRRAADQRSALPPAPGMFDSDAKGSRPTVGSTSGAGNVRLRREGQPTNGRLHLRCRECSTPMRRAADQRSALPPVPGMFDSDTKGSRPTVGSTSGAGNVRLRREGQPTNGRLYLRCRECSTPMRRAADQRSALPPVPGMFESDAKGSRPTVGSTSGAGNVRLRYKGRPTNGRLYLWCRECLTPMRRAADPRSVLPVAHVSSAVGNTGRRRSMRCHCAPLAAQ